MLLDTLKLLRLGMSNPVSRAVVMLGDRHRPGEQSRLNLALRNFACDEPLGGFTDRAYSLLVKAVLGVGCQAFGTDIESIKDYLREETVRRAVSMVLSSIGLYGVTRPQLLKAPFLVVWNFTNACNLRCKHCYQNAGERLTNELSTKEKIAVVNELADAGVVAIAFSGGEPLASPEFFDIAKTVRDKGLYVALATNGTMLTKDKARILRKIDVCYVEVSLDAASPELHDSFRGISGSYARSLEGIRNCVEEGIFTSCLLYTSDAADE